MFVLIERRLLMRDALPQLMIACRVLYTSLTVYWSKAKQDQPSGPSLRYDQPTLYESFNSISTTEGKPAVPGCSHSNLTKIDSRGVV
eukprot:3318351-Pyramimonas_sp.AAC.1